MIAMRELNLEIPVLEIPFPDAAVTHFLGGLLKHVEFTYLLRIRGEGFLMICRVAPNPGPLGDPLTAEDLFDRIDIKVLGTERSGAMVLQISGAWKRIFDSSGGEDSKLVRFMRSIKEKPIYVTKNPTFQGGVLRLSLLGEDVAIGDMLEEMKFLDIPYRVARLGRTKTHRESPLADLTERQMSILRLAHSLGYYEVPKRTRVEDIARLLGVDKGTAGEHLQRAERHVFDRLFR